jgi:hypothetical protein
VADKAIQPAQEGDWRPKVFVFGGLIGAVVGLLSAYLYVRASEERGDSEPPEVPGTGDAVRLGTALLAIVRTVSEWGARR